MELMASHIGIEPGNGVVGRFGDTVVLIPRDATAGDADRATRELLGLASAVAANPQLPATAVAARLAGWVIDRMTQDVAAFGIVVPVRDGVVMFLRGAVWGAVSVGGDVRQLSGQQALTWVDQLIPGTFDWLQIGIEADRPVRADPLSDLRGGVVPGQGFVVTRVAGGGAPAPDSGQADLVAPAWSPEAAPSAPASPMAPASPVAPPSPVAEAPPAPAEVPWAEPVAPAAPAPSAAVPSEPPPMNVVASVEPALPEASASPVHGLDDGAASDEAEPAGEGDWRQLKAVDPTPYDHADEPAPYDGADTWVSSADEHQPIETLGPDPIPGRGGPGEPGLATLTARAPGVLASRNGPPIVLDQVYVFGRDPHRDPAVESGEAAPIVMQDPDNVISRVHAYVYVENGQVFVRDAASLDGTYISPPGADEWIKIGPDPSQLPPGWSLRIGAQVFTYNPAGPADAG